MSSVGLTPKKKESLMKDILATIWMCCACAVLSANGGCSAPDGAKGPFKYTLSLPASQLGSIAQETAAALLVDGQERGRFSQTGGAAFEVPASEFIAGKSILIRLEGVCGSVDVPVSLLEGADGEKRGRKNPRYGVRIPLTVPRQPPECRTVYVDNLDGNDTVVDVGRIALKVRARSSHRTRLVLGDCREVAAIKVSGEVFGSLPETDGKQAVLIDIAKGHCYVAADVVYRSKEFKGDSKKRLAPTLFREGPIHVVPIVGYVLEEPPATLGTSTGAITHTEIQRTSCK